MTRSTRPQRQHRTTAIYHTDIDGYACIVANVKVSIHGGDPFERKTYDITQTDLGWYDLIEHFVAALLHPLFCELCMIQRPWQWARLKDPPHIEVGHLPLRPDTPGLGAELARDLEARFPYLSGSRALPVQREGVVAAR